MQYASQVALQNGTTPADCFDAVRDLRRAGVGPP